VNHGFFNAQDGNETVNFLDYLGGPARAPSKGILCLRCSTSNPALVVRSGSLPRMVEVARELNPEISFRTGNIMNLDLPDGFLVGISAFYAIVNIPNESLPLVFRKMERVLQPSGQILLTFHVGER
jgi:SAM-dependent methyltransferase